MSFVVSYFAGAGAQFFDSNGDPLVGGLIYTYAAGTTTPATTYTSNTGSSSNTNPIVLNSAGRTPYDIWVQPGEVYKFVLKTSMGATIGTYDNIPGVGDPSTVNNLITVTGTNVLIGTSTVPATAYVLGMQISFVAVATNTGAMTLNLDGLGARDITLNGSTAIAAGVITIGQIVTCTYDGLTFQANVVPFVSASRLESDLFYQLTTVASSGDDYFPIADVSDSNKNKKALVSSIPGGLTAATPVSTDYVVISDTSDSNIGKKALISSLLALVPSAASFATSAEAQALSSNTVVISPLSLKQAFQGTNQSLATSGYQKLPGGWILQMGTYSQSGYGVNVTFPVAFPTACVCAIATSADSAQPGPMATASKSTTIAQFTNNLWSGGYSCLFFAVGY